MSKLAAPAVLRGLVGDLRQIASVRRILLADAAGAGVEALAFSTGGGLDFWVAAGRMLDVATLSWRGVQIGWQSPAGLSPRSVPSSGADRERLFNRGFGGFLNTCGFDHIRQPAGGRPLHGSAPFTPAGLTSFGENWDADEPVLYCEGEAVVWAYGAGGHRLHRRIEAPIGGASLRIRDAVEVIGPEPSPVMALYHFQPRLSRHPGQDRSQARRTSRGRAAGATRGGGEPFDHLSGFLCMGILPGRLRRQ